MKNLTNPNFSSLIPSPKNLASYALIPVSIILAAILFGLVTKGHFDILRKAHRICWTEGNGIMVKIKVVKSVVLLFLVVVAILMESLAVIDYINGESVDYMPMNAIIGIELQIS